MQQLINAYKSNEIYISSSQTVISKKLVTLMFSVKTNIFNFVKIPCFSIIQQKKLILF